MPDIDHQTSQEKSDFKEPYSLGSFLVLMVATLLIFSMSTSQSLLPVVLGARGYPESVVGYAMSITIVPVLLFGLVCGLFISKHGPINGIIIGSLLAVCAHLSFDLLPQREVSLFISRFLHGTAMGFLLPAIITMSKAMLTGPRQTINFGIFTSAIPGANIIGPPLGDFYFRTFGTHGYFLITAIPGIISIALFWYLHRKFSRVEIKHNVVFGYFKILKRSEIFTPLYGMIFPALLWGYVLSFVSLALVTKGLIIGIFFAATTVALIAGRFVMVKIVSSAPKNVAVLGAILIMSASLVLVASFGGIGITILAGALLGLSYSIVYPILSMWVANDVPEALKPQAIALTNTLFNTFMYVTPLVCGYFLTLTDIISFQVYFSLGIALAAIGFFLLLPQIMQGQEK
ncbi:MAG TPA: MFS transporter [Rhodobacteraceae bacterium]|nr:MFS transporter [Paracoccaceae bacterium]